MSTNCREEDFSLLFHKCIPTFYRVFFSPERICLQSPFSVVQLHLLARYRSFRFRRDIANRIASLKSEKLREKERERRKGKFSTQWTYRNDFSVSRGDWVACFSTGSPGSWYYYIGQSRSFSNGIITLGEESCGTHGNNGLCYRTRVTLFSMLRRWLPRLAALWIL